MLQRDVREGRVEMSPDAENGVIGLVELSRQAGLAQSNGEARRLVQQNAVSLDGEKETDFARKIDLDAEAPFVLKVGKRQFVRVVHPG